MPFVICTALIWLVLELHIPNHAVAQTRDSSALEKELAVMTGLVFREQWRSDIRGWTFLGSGFANGPASGVRAGQSCTRQQWEEESVSATPLHDCHARQRPSYARIKKDGREAFVSTVIVAFDGEVPLNRLVQGVLLDAPMEWPTWSRRCARRDSVGDGNVAIVANVRFGRCERFTSKVIRAWEWDMNALTLRRISPAGLVCEDVEFGQTPATDGCVERMQR